MDDKFRSRKYRITGLCVLSALVAALAEKMSPSLSAVLVTVVGSYNLKDSFKK